MRRHGVALSFAVVLCASGAACNAVLGLDDLQPFPDAGSTTDAATDGPLRIANPGVPPTCLVLQRDRIFYCIGQRVIVANRDGNEPHDFVPEGGVGTFAAGPAGACWTSNGMLLAQGLDGGPSTVVVDGGVRESVACVGAFAYFAAATDAGTEVKRVRIDVASAPESVMEVTSLDSMAARDYELLVADENRVSRVLPFGLDDAGNQLDAASVTSLAATAPHAIVGAGSRAAWVRGASSNVDTTTDFVATSTVAVAHTPTAIAVYGEDVYTVSTTDGLVLRRTPTETKVIAAGQTGVRLIAVDDVSIVWATATAIFILPRI